MIRQTRCEDAEAVAACGRGGGGEEGRTQILQMTREEIRRKSQEFQQWYTVLRLTGIGDMCRNKRRAELLLDP